MNPKIAILVFFLAAAPVHAAIAPVGVFAVLDSLERKTVGTAFLIDSEYGWFLTACHVLPVAYPDPNGPSVLMRWKFQVTSSDVRTKEMKLVVIASGFDYTNPDELKKHKNTKRDWAVLKVNIDEHRALMPLFREFCVQRDLKVETLEILSSNVSSAVQVYGIPVGDTEIRPDRGTLGQGQVASGLWNVSVPVVAGNSGGPVGLLEASHAMLAASQKISGATLPLLGLMIKQVTTTGGHSEMLPSYLFVSECAKAIPKTEKVLRFMSYLDEKSELADWDLKAELLLRGLNAIEHWQIVNALCVIGQTKPGRVAEFLVKNYSNERFQQGFSYLFSCNRNLVTAMFEETKLLLGNLKNGGVQQISPGSVELIGDLRDWVVANQTNVLASDAKATSAFLTDAVYISERVYGFPQTAPTSQNAIAAALRLDPANGDIPTVAAVAIKELNAGEKDVLIRGTVIIGQGPEKRELDAIKKTTTAREFVLDSEDSRFLKMRITGVKDISTIDSKKWLQGIGGSDQVFEGKQKEKFDAAIAKVRGLPDIVGRK